jgi:hypothetical protein
MSKAGSAVTGASTGSTGMGYGDGDTIMAGRDFDQQGPAYGTEYSRSSMSDVTGYGAAGLRGSAYWTAPASQAY